MSRVWTQEELEAYHENEDEALALREEHDGDIGQSAIIGDYPYHDTYDKDDLGLDAYQVEPLFAENTDMQGAAPWLFITALGALGLAVVVAMGLFETAAILKSLFNWR